jgi:hypothetical protein
MKSRYGYDRERLRQRNGFHCSVAAQAQGVSSGDGEHGLKSAVRYSRIGPGRGSQVPQADPDSARGPEAQGRVETSAAFVALD